MPQTLHSQSSRFNKIRASLSRAKVDAILLNSEANVTYASGFHAPESYLLVTKKDMILMTDFRYASDFTRKAKPPLVVKQYQGSFIKTIVSTIKDVGAKNVGFESRHLSFAECQKFHESAEKSISFIPLNETIEPIREIKEETEINNIKHALSITRKAYAYIETQLKVGSSELDIAAELEYFIRRQGASSSAFDIIVASGINSSYPHARITSRKLCQGEPIIIDLGVIYNDYKCDLTRTFFLGKINPIVQKVARIVSDAQKKAIKTIRPGVSIDKIDAEARNYITEQGFGKFFGHALGHGVGLQVHEAPSINKKNHHLLKKGMVFTVEPGIYIANDFGIRIEDMVLVTDKGVEVLSGNISN